MAKKKMRLRFSQEVSHLGDAPPQIIGVDGKRTMTVRDLLMSAIPESADRDKTNRARLWNIALEIDRSKDKYIDLTELDFKLLQNAIMAGQDNRQLWAAISMENAFDEAKEVEKGKK